MTDFYTSYWVPPSSDWYASVDSCAQRRLLTGNRLAIEPIYYDFLEWAVELEKATEIPEGQKHHKSAVFIVE